MDKQAATDHVELVPNGGWDQRVLVCRCAPTVDSFVVVTTRYVVIVDTLLNPATATALLDIVRPLLREGRTPLVLNTHADWDHCWGNQLFAGPEALLPAPIIAQANSIARYGEEMAEQLRANHAAYPGRFDTVVPTAPTITFTERLVIDGGDLTLELLHAPGHTDDHLAIDIPEISTLLAGDAAEAPFPFATTIDGLVLLRRTLRELAALRARSALYCHAPGWHDATLIARNIAYFDRLEGYCRAALAAHRAPADDSGTRAAEVSQLFGELATVDLPSPELLAMYRKGHQQHIALMLDLLIYSE